MTQNIYDRPEFFENYSQLPRSIEGLDGAPEWPALRALLPDVRGLRVLDLGCGFGWFCRWARDQGAARVHGIDVSENMLARARADGTDAITYERADLETDALPKASFELAFSSLALHYVVDLAGLVDRVHRALLPGSGFVFSVEHPIYMAPSQPSFQHDAHGRAFWPVDGYLNEGPRTTDWLTRGVVKQYRTIATHVNLLVGRGFTLQRLDEWGPSLDQLAEYPQWAIERERPMFLLVSARR